MKKNIIYQGNSVISVETHPEYSRPVVIKKPSKPRPSRRSLRFLEKEYEMTRSLNAVEGVRKALGQESIDNQPSLILEYIDGETLRDYIGRKTLRLRAKLEIAVDLTRILENIHQHDVIHLDLNSKNILIANEHQAVHLIDLGSASHIFGNVNQKVRPDQLLGTLPYISPEQTGRINRAVDERSDLYSLGVVLFELMTRQLPFDSKDPIQLIHQHLTRIPVSPSEVSSEIPEVISTIILKLLSKNAEDRYQSAGGVQADLEKCLQRLSPHNTIEEFPPGEADYTSRLIFPQKLYGRDRELKKLESAFESVCRGSSSIIFVGGYSGIGKTVLVEELRQTVAVADGYFLRGKFDQYLRTTPYTAIAQAFGALQSQILAEPEASYREWQDRIRSAVGDLGKVLMDVIPALAELIGAQPDVPRLEGHEAENRLHYLFTGFLSAVATEEHPLVLFLDDLQWIDAASLKLLDVIRRNFEQPGLLVIGAYRDNEVSASHPLSVFFESQEEAGIPLQTLKLDDLEPQTVATLLSDVLRSGEGIEQLDKIFLEKTRGNPFFLRWLLYSLNEEGLMRYDAETNSWHWDLGEINSAGIADNVADFLARTITQLPEESQNFLSMAACIGNRFDLTTLALISGQNEPEVTKLLTAPLIGQYIFGSGDTYQFVHDQVQQAAYAFSDESHRAGRHLEIGRVLLADTTPTDLEKWIFDIVAHYDLGASLLADEAEKLEVARLNLIAGRTARLNSAFDAAAVYLRQAVRLLGESAWQDHYGLTLDVFSELIEVCHLNIEHEEVEALFDTIAEKAKQDVDAGVAYKTLITSCVAQHELGRAISLAERYLEQLNVPLDSERESDLSKAELYELPQMQDKEKLAAMEILMAIAAPVLFSAPERLPSVVYTMLNLISRYGNNSKSSFAYASYAYTLCLMQRYQEGNHFGQLAVNMLEKYPDPGRTAGIMNMLYTNVRHWTQPVHDQITPLKTCHRMAMQAGDFEYGLYSLLNYTLLLWGSGKPLEHCLAEVEPSISLCQSKNQQFALQSFLMVAEFALNLTGMSPATTRLEGKWFSEQTMMSRLSGNHYLLALYGLLKMELHYLFGEPSAAYDHVDEVLKNRGSFNPHYLYTKMSFYGGLACLAGLADAEEDADRQERLDKLEQFEKELALWAEVAPMNYRHEHLLLQAEKSRVTNDQWQAVQFYEAAIEDAQENEYIHEQALASELCARFWLESGNDRIAESYMRDAHALYDRWGAGAKVSHIEDSYPQWFETRAKSVVKPDTSGTVDSTITQTITSIQLDMESIISASQTLSAETDLQQLLIRMMALVMANSGAEKAVLLLKQGADWFVQARGDITTEKLDVLLNRPFDPADSYKETDLVPKRVFSYCRRSKEVLIVGDAQQDHRFTEDRLIQKYNIKSMTCIPALNRGELKAILYLENRQISDAFTLERVEILKHLSFQFAVSVENALLYENLKQAEAKYRTVADFTYDWEYWANMDGTLNYVSPSCERVSGYSVQDFMDNPSLFREIIVPQDREMWDRHYRDVRPELKPQEIQFRIYRRDGEIRWIEHACQPVTDNTGRSVGFRVSNREITDRKQVEIELHDAYAEIEQLKNQLEAESAYLQDEIKLEHNFENIIGQSESLKYVLHRVEQVASTDSPVLIMGETGTGKELVARAIHDLSPHRKRALVKVNCAALPGELIESELFGREKGAFTGATTTQPGRFELAKGSTLFLDEIGELPFELQAKLLRVLESGEFERLGSPRTLHSDARIIAATNRVLEEEVRKGRFRKDLWYRLKVFPITVPPLREHPEDIPLLVRWFVDQLTRKMGKHAAEIPKRTMQMLQGYPWPGNVRELKHAVEAAMITAQGKKLNFELPQIADTALSGFKSFEEMERDYILRVLKAKHWKIGGANSAASTLGMHVNTLRGRMKKLGIKRPKS